MVIADVGVNYVVKAKDGYVYIEDSKPVEKRGLYDLCIDNGWNLQWYEKYKKHLNTWTSY